MNDIYQWNTTDQRLTPISDDLWCSKQSNCSGGKGRDHVVLNIVCQCDDKRHQICLATRRASEPGPFICKRRLIPGEGK
jgi:hypothetical protein